MTKKLTLEFVNDYAEHRGGKCLSDVYVNDTSYLLWKCDKGHEWKAPLCRLRNQKTWCPRCAREKKD